MSSITRRWGACLLALHCWAPGNSATLDQTLTALTGEPLNPAYLAARCNQSPEEAWRNAQDALSRSDRTETVPGSVELGARISLVHGSERIADNEVSLQAMYVAFERWIERKSESERHAYAS